MGKKMKNANKSRSNELIGGGYIVLRRDSNTGRVMSSPTGKPFEHPSLEAASTEAARLAQMFRGKRFCVFQQVADATAAIANSSADETNQQAAE